MAASPESCSRDSIDSEAPNGEFLNDAASPNEHNSDLEKIDFPNDINAQGTTNSSDEIPEQVKVLDEIISAYEDSVPPIINAAENQSEDDGYMSLSRKNMHQKDNKDDAVDSSSDSKVERKSVTEDGSFEDNKKEYINTKNLPVNNLIQSTLPKARSTATNTTSYSSLPCSGMRSVNNDTKAKYGSCAGERNVLGIDISAVHNAVLRGELSKQLPEPIVNEHPVTIYPGRLSPPLENPRGNRPHRIISSVEKHKEVCHILNPGSMVSSSSSTSSSSSSSTTSGDFSLISSNLGIKKPSKPKSKERKQISNFIDNESSRKCYNDKRNGVAGDPGASVGSSSQSSSLAYPKKSNGVAWEIYFKSERKKTKTLIGNGGGNSNGKEDIIANNGIDSIDGLTYEKSVHKKLSHETDDKSPVDSTTKNYSEDFNYEKPIDSNMCGKGTFVIRRSVRKAPPKAADIFKHSSKLHHHHHHSQHHNSNHEQKHSKPYYNSVIIDNDYHKNEDEIKLKSTPICPRENSLNRNKEKERDIEKERERDRHKERENGKDREKEKEIRDSERIRECDRERNSGSSQYDDVPLRRDLNYKRSQETPPMDETRRSLTRNSLKHSEKVSFDSSESLSEKSRSKEILFDDRKDLVNSYGYKDMDLKCKTQEYSDLRASNASTPHTDLAPTLEEDEEQLSDMSYGNGPLKQIENNISALLRGDICVAHFGPNGPTTNGITAASINAISSGVVAVGGATSKAEKAYQGKRVLEFRPGVHKSESSKEMLLSQNMFGPLPPSPPSSNPDLFDYDDMPPLPPSPHELARPINEHPKAYIKTTAAEVHADMSGDKGRFRSSEKPSVSRHFSDELPLPLQLSFDNVPPVPPHRSSNVNTIKSWSIDSNYKRKSPKMLGYMGSSTTTPTSMQAPSCEGTYTNRRVVNYGTKRSLKQSPREESRLQTSCSLPETPIFGRGCDIPRTPYRRQNENTVSGSRTAPRSSTSTNINMSTSIVGIAAGSAYGSSICRQRSINHALASNELLRMSGAPARGWYPKQRSMRPMSTENIDRVTSVRVWDGNSGMSTNGHSRKPLTLPPNLTPSFLNKSPREALRRVASLLITKKKNNKDHKHKNGREDTLLDISSYEDIENTSIKKEERKRSKSNTAPKTQKKKGIFKTLWKKTKHFSLDQ